jgi:hypothetical protein
MSTAFIIHLIPGVHSVFKADTARINEIDFAG